VTQQEEQQGQGVVEVWKQSFEDRAFQVEAAVTLVFFTGILTLYPNYLNWIEARDGVRFTDPVLSRFEPVDVTFLAFVILYAAVIAAIWFLLKEPRYLMVGLQSYVVLFTFRAIALYLVPLDHPQQMILFKDPFVEFFGVDGTLTKDLFFSGHTSLMFLLYLTARIRWLRRAFLFWTAVLAGCLLIQHVHYTFDVFMAPFAAYVGWRMVVAAHRGVLDIGER
jgi:hypothetical protein